MSYHHRRKRDDSIFWGQNHGIILDAFLSFYIVNHSVIFRNIFRIWHFLHLHVVFQIQLIIFSRLNFCICLLTCLPADLLRACFLPAVRMLTPHKSLEKRKSEVFIVANDVLCLPTSSVSPLSSSSPTLVILGYDSQIVLLDSLLARLEWSYFWHFVFSVSCCLGDFSSR